MNKKRNWYGKEYEEKYYGKIKIKYKGKYQNGKMNGKGREHYINNRRKFEGIYCSKYKGKGYDAKFCIIINTLDDGKGYIIELDNYNSLKYKEECINGKKWKR